MGGLGGLVAMYSHLEDLADFIVTKKKGPVGPILYSLDQQMLMFDTSSKSDSSSLVT